MVTEKTMGEVRDTLAGLCCDRLHELVDVADTDLVRVSTGLAKTRARKPERYYFVAVEVLPRDQS